MFVVRIGGMTQLAWDRTASAVSGTTSNFAVKLQPAIGRAGAVLQAATILVADFLSPAALVSLVLGLWRLGTDVGWTGQFIISYGLFSHWQVWIALAIGLETLAALGSRSNKTPESSEQH